jgi:hypothetical protein
MSVISFETPVARTGSRPLLHIRTVSIPLRTVASQLRPKVERARWRWLISAIREIWLFSDEIVRDWRK